MLKIPEAPNEISGLNILIRTIDGIKFRYQVATWGIDEKDYAFKPSDDAMSLEKLLKHIYNLQKGIFAAYSQKEANKEEPTTNQLIDSTVSLLDQIRMQLSTMNDQDLLNVSFHKHTSWHIINGPIADTLTHIGQINMMRRLFDNPVPKASVLTGTFDPENQ